MPSNPGSHKEQFKKNLNHFKSFIDLCVENNIPVNERNFSLYDVYDADECFVTGTFAGVSPVISIDGRTIENKSNNEISASLSILYKKLISDYVRK